MIAAQLYTVRDQLQDPSHLARVLGHVREIGYRAVEVAGLGPKTIGRFGSELKRADLVACAAHVPLDRLQKDLDGVAEQCREWGCSYAVIAGLPAGYYAQDGHLRFAAEAEEVALKMRPHGLRLAYHNHSVELQRFGRQTWLESLFATAPADALQAELDTYWLQYGGASPPAWIRRFRGRLPLVHLKDMAVVGRDPVMAEIGEGNLDWADILGACKEAETKWLIVEQDECRRDPMESLAISYINLSKLAANANLES